MKREEAGGSGERPSLASIRSRLRDLGYLNDPLTGWMLAGRGGPSSLLRISAMASLRAGVIGGLLLGAAAAAAVAMANRPHLGSARDLLVLWLYLSGMLAPVLVLLEFFADRALVWLGRRGLILIGRAERLAGRVGIFFTTATTLYLASLLRGGHVTSSSRPTGPDTGLPGWLLWGAAVVGALAVGHIVGRLSRLGSLIALAASVPGGSIVLPSDRAAAGGATKRRSILALGSACLLALALLLVFAPVRPAGGLRGASGFKPMPFEGRIVLIGIDGLDGDLCDWLAGKGIAPALAAIQARSARYALAAGDDRVPPVTWTTIATGRPPSEHGILGYEAERLPGLTAPLQEPAGRRPLVLSPSLLLPPRPSSRSAVSGGQRTALAVWEILADGGLATAAVNWWATWPALPGAGIVVSERAFMRFASGGEPAHEVEPPELQAALAGRFKDDLAQARAAVAAAGVDRSDELATAAAILDGYHALVAQRLLQGGRARVVVVYLPGLDIIRARRQPARIAPDDATAPGSDLVALARHLDRLLGDFTRSLQPDDLLLILGEPGRSPAAGRGGVPEGILLAQGGRVVPGVRPIPVRDVDVAPTLLALAGFPRALDMPGRPVVDFLRAGDIGARMGGTIDTYGAREEPLPGPGSDRFDQEALDRLRGLGYIQ